MTISGNIVTALSLVSIIAGGLLSGSRGNVWAVAGAFVMGMAAIIKRLESNSGLFPFIKYLENSNLWIEFS